MMKMSAFDLRLWQMGVNMKQKLSQRSTQLLFNPLTLPIFLKLKYLQFSRTTILIRHIPWLQSPVFNFGNGMCYCIYSRGLLTWIYPILTCGPVLMRIIIILDLYFFLAVSGGALPFGKLKGNQKYLKIAFSVPYEIGLCSLLCTMYVSGFIIIVICFLQRELCNAIWVI